LKFAALLIRSFQISQKARKQSGGLVTQNAYPLKLFHGCHAGIHGNIEQRLHFPRRTFGCGQELSELLVALAFKALGNISHDGYCSPPKLVPQGKIRRNFSLGGDFINNFGKLTSFFPGINVLKALDFRHSFKFKVQSSKFKVDFMFQSPTSGFYKSQFQINSKL
jgi:hypothetical protein